MAPKYTQLDTTDNTHLGGGSDVYGDGDDDGFDDIFITPDVETTNNKSASNKKAPANDAPTTNAGNTATSSSQAGASQPLFSLSSFITPQLPDFGVQIETRERPFSGGNTLDESVLTTLHRDLATIGDKLLSILWPLRLRQSLMAAQKVSTRIHGRITTCNSDYTPGTDVEDAIGSADASSQDEYSSETMKKIRDWDLWGPLVINLMFSLIITFLQSSSLSGDDKAKSNEASSQTFSAAFTLIWASLAVLSLNVQLLSPVQQKLENGGVSNGVLGLSFFQCVSLLSYSMFPIVVGGLISVFVKFKFIRLIVNMIMLAWSLLCTSLIMAIVSNCKRRGTLTFMVDEEEVDDSQGDQRIFLMVYPVFLVFGLFSWFCVIV